MSFLSYFFTPIAISIILGTVACAENVENKSNPDSFFDNKQKELGQKFNGVSFTGSYLATRVARIHYDFDNAKKNAENSFILSPMTDPYLADQAVRLSLIEQDFSSAIELSNKHLEKLNYKNNSEQTIGIFPVITVLVDAINKNDKAKAVEVFEKFQKSFNKPMRALVGGTIYRFKNDVKKAKLIEANLGEFELFDMMRIYHEANGLYVNGQKTEALEFFKKSSNYSDTLAVRSILSAVQIYLDNGQKDKAVDVLKSHRKNQPDGLIWAATESLETGENFKFNLPTTYSQMMGEDLYNIGVLYARQNDFESAIAFFRAAETAGVSHVYLLSALAETYALVKDYNTAAELYLQIAKEDKFLVGRESIIGAAFTLNVAGRHDEAEKLLVDALEKDKKYYRYPYILADLLRGQDEFKKAIPYFSQALSVLTEKEQKIKWRILYGRAISYEQTGEWDKAEKDFLEALTLAPNNPDLINYLAYSWVDRGVHLEKALLMLQHAVNLSPNNGYIADSLGWALFRMGKYEEALPILEQAVILMPNEAVINDHVGDVYWKLGREQEAEFQWKHALDFKPSSKDKKMIEAKIEVGYNDALVYLEKKALETKNTSPIKEEPQKHESFINVIRSFFSGFSK